MDAERWELAQRLGSRYQYLLAQYDAYTLQANNLIAQNKPVPEALVMKMTAISHEMDAIAAGGRPGSGGE